jgi:DNA-directed RNA polymerase subunit RPC12/RpoP
MRIHLSCPQCGAPVELEETEFLLECAYCRVRLLLSSRGPCRYYLQASKEVPAKDLFYVPYWRLKGTGYALDQSQIIYKLLDTSLLARQLQDFPFSLGLRPQAMQLRFVTPDLPGHFLSPNTGRRFLLEQVCRKLVQGTELSQAGIKRQDFVGEVFSLVYAPFYFHRGQVFDAITDRVVAKIGSDFPFARQEKSNKKQKIDFKPTLCPYCGWDMLGESRSATLLCPGCYRAWAVTSSDFKQVGLGIQEAGQKGDYQLPFWQLGLQDPEIKLQSKADLIRLANIPRPLSPQTEKEPLFLWIPAFKIRPELFLRIAQQTTFTGPRVKELKNMPQGQQHPADLPLKEGLQSLPYLLTSLGPAKRRVIALLGQKKIKVHSAKLVYMAFKARGNELLQEEMQLSIPRKALQWGTYL